MTVRDLTDTSRTYPTFFMQPYEKNSYVLIWQILVSRVQLVVAYAPFHSRRHRTVLESGSVADQQWISKEISFRKGIFDDIGFLSWAVVVRTYTPATGEMDNERVDVIHFGCFTFLLLSVDR